MKRFTFATALFSVSMLVIWTAFQFFAPSFVKAQNTVDQPLSVHRAKYEAYIPVTGVEAKILAPAPVYDASGRIVALHPGGSSNQPVILAPAASRKVAPVYDASGSLISDPTGTIQAINNAKIAPVFDANGKVISDPTGILSNTSNP